jgi:hypothetical protein
VTAPTGLNVNVHVRPQTEFSLYRLDRPSGRDVLHFGDDVSVFFDPADLIRLRDAIDAYLQPAPAEQMETV